MGDRPQAR